MSNKRLLKSTSVIGFATLCSRLLGFVRDILIAKLYGTTVFAEAFVVAFRIPNVLRDLIGEGASNAAFVPVLTEYRARQPEKEFWHLARNLLYLLVIVLFVITLLGIFFAPFIVRLIAPGFISSPEKLNITITLTRIMFPFIFLVGLTAYSMGVLNSLHHFAAPAFGPIFLNIAMILFLLYICPKVGIMGLAFAVLAGGGLQIIATIPVLYSKGLRFPSITEYGTGHEFIFFHPAIKKIWRLLVPRFFGSAVYQLSVIVDNIFSTFEWIVGVGAPAALWYSYRLFHLPLAIFGIALATVALPKMSKDLAQDDMAAFKGTINFSIRSVLLILVPAGVGLATLGKPIIQILFERGEFTPYSTAITNSALFFYSFGLFACGGIKILVNSFFSLGDTTTPVKVASVSFFINLVLNYLLMWPLKVGGLALATSIAATANFVMLYLRLTRRIGKIGTRQIASTFYRVLSASLIMGVFSLITGNLLYGLKEGFLVKMAAISAVIAASILIYLLSGLMLGIREIKESVKWISKRN